jgi:RNA polymerase sigma-70 factor (ECF subfamily)
MIARNLYRDGQRRDWRARELEPGLPDPAPGPEKAAGDRDALRRVLDALAQLPEADRAALLLSAQEGLTSDEIAATLGLSVAAVKVKIHRARLRLNELRRAWETKP